MLKCNAMSACGKVRPSLPNTATPFATQMLLIKVSVTVMLASFDVYSWVG